ncbi:PAN3 protein, partial [Polypterus senegalus]
MFAQLSTATGRTGVGTRRVELKAETKSGGPPRYYRTISKTYLNSSGGKGGGGGGGGSGGEGSGAMNSGHPASAVQLSGVGIPGVKVKYCRYYAKDKTCFYGDECQFLHEDPSMAGLVLHSGGSPVPLSLSTGAPVSGYTLGGAGPSPGAAGAGGGGGSGGHGAGGSVGAGSSIGVVGPKKNENMGSAGPGLEASLLTIPGLDGSSLAEVNPTNSYFSSTFIGLNGSPAEHKYSMIQRMTSSSSSPSLLNDSAKTYNTHDLVNSPASTSLFNEFAALNISQRRKAPNPAANEFVPKGATTPRMSNVSQSSMSAFSTALFSHPSMGSTSAAGLAPGMSLSAGSSPLHSPKITPHTSPAPRRRSHTPNPANYMVPTNASAPGSDSAGQSSASQIIQKETVGGTTYFYTDSTPAPLTGMELINRHLITMAQIDQGENPGVPAEVDNYHSLFPLEPLPPPNRLQKTSNFSYVTSCYKAVNSKDDLPYCLRRIHAGQHDGPPPRQHAGLLPESLIWAYIVQLSSALRTIHTAGLACRVMDPTKILITGKTRLRVNCVGICDVLTFDNSQTNPLAMMAQYQQADLISLGKIVLALACNSLAGIQRENLQKAMELVSINYSSDLKNLILFQKDPSWSETGDRYLLKLFRDHLFHQVSEAGTPWIDLSHIVSCLNKLDAGVPEKVSLVSRDEKSILVVTYADLKRCFENTFQELLAAANGQL